jgi:2-methylisocitrate lyase-like PEP mutase family enzyme
MPSSLRDALSAGPMILAPGAYEALTARLVAQSGFPAVYMTGAGTAVAHGYPDYGLLTMTEMVDNAARMTAAVDIPVIADADTGYGSELNVIRTVHSYARAGVAAIHIEDQNSPNVVVASRARRSSTEMPGCARSGPPPSVARTPAC